MSIDIIERRSNPHKIVSNMSLNKLLDRIIHYTALSPGFVRAVRPSSMEYISIISDRDIEELNVEYRELRTDILIKFAEEIARDDRKVLKHLMNNTINLLTEDIKNSDKDRDKFFGLKTIDCLVYVFRLIRKIGNFNLPEGNITMFFVDELQDKNHNHLSKKDIEYSKLFEYFGQDWYIGYTYLDEYSKNIKSELYGKKVLYIMDHSERVKSFNRIGVYVENAKGIILADDLLNLLKQIQ